MLLLVTASTATAWPVTQARLGLSAAAAAGCAAIILWCSNMAMVCGGAVGVLLQCCCAVPAVGLVS
jgi:hypothetical protein